MKILGSSILLVTAVMMGCSESPTSPKAMSSAPSVSAQCNTNSNNSNNPPVTAGNCGTNNNNNTGNNSNNPPTTADH